MRKDFYWPYHSVTLFCVSGITNVLFCMSFDLFVFQKYIEWSVVLGFGYVLCAQHHVPSTAAQTIKTSLSSGVMEEIYEIWYLSNYSSDFITDRSVDLCKRNLFDNCEIFHHKINFQLWILYEDDSYCIMDMLHCFLQE